MLDRGGLGERVCVDSASGSWGGTEGEEEKQNETENPGC